MNPGFKKQPLSVIGKELIKAGEAMKEISGAPGRFECLKEFSESADLIEWLKSGFGS